MLSLRKAAIGAEPESIDVRVPVGIFDVQLPARQFVVRHKVAEVGEVSLTTEFLLRLLHSADGMPEETAASFFGFNANEMAYVIRDAEARAYISRSEGRIWLTDAGNALFKASDKPQIYDVAKKTERVGFDLLSLAPCDREHQSEFERSLPELAIRDPDLVANASRHVPESFRRFYGEISSRRDREAVDQLKRSLYSVDDVVAGDRFSAVVPFVAMASVRRPSEPEALLEKWRTGHELADRDRVVHGVAEFLENLRTVKTPEDVNALDVLTNIAPEYLKEYVNRSGFASLRYFKELAGRAGELRSNRPTVGIAGALYQPENIVRITTAIGYANEPALSNDDVFLWVVPKQSAWGASRSFLELLETLTKEGVDVDATGRKMERSPILIDEGKPQRRLTKAAPTIFCRPNTGAIPSSLEVLLIPRRVAAVVVHAPINDGRGFPIPLGILSFDAAIVRRVHRYLTDHLPADVTKYGSTGGFNIRSCLEWPQDTDAAAVSNSET
ncbi:MAG TPA: hypothetical protein VFJ87_10620 [Rhodanobacteraceae bacterium]|nr:hypothetical protein [Rhodanobacteraceae bacterium]